MTEFVRFQAAFEHKNEETGQRTRYPALWFGDVEPDVATAAREAGALEGTEDSEDATINAMTKDELLAEAKKRGVDVKASDSKADILAALKA